MTLEHNKRYNPADMWKELEQIGDEATERVLDQENKGKVPDSVLQFSHSYRELEYYLGNTEAARVLNKLKQHWAKFPGLTEADHQILDAEAEHKVDEDYR